MGAVLLLAAWITIGFAVTVVLLVVEDREQRRERNAREQGFYAPVRTLKPRAHARVSVPADGEPSGGDDADRSGTVTSFR